MPPPESERGPRQGPAPSAIGHDRRSEDSARPRSRQIRRDPQFHRLTERLHWLGPRPIGELLLEVASGRDLIDALEDYATLDPSALARLGGRNWPTAIWRAA